MEPGKQTPPSPKGKRKMTETVRVFVDKHKGNVIMYSALVVSILFVYHFLSDGDFSFLMTLGSVLRAFAFVILVFKIWSQRSVAGVSLKTLLLYALVFSARLMSILVYDGYLPFDRSGDWLYQTVEVSALALVLVCVWLMKKFEATRNASADTFGSGLYLPDDLGVLWLIVPCFLLALILHPNLNGNFLTDTAWTFALYLEAVAVMPQLYMFQKNKDREIEAFTSHWIFCIGSARIMHLLFWLSSYHELNDMLAAHAGAQYPGYFVIISQLCHVALMTDYCFYYLKSIKTGKPLMLPLNRPAMEV